MDDQLLSMLGKALHSLESDASALDELIVPRAPSAGENAGVAAQRGKSKPPVVVPILDVKLETLSLLAGWVGELRAAWPEEGLDVPGESIGEKAAWLNQHLLLVESSPWAEMCAEEIVAQARFVSDIVMPPASASDPEPLEVGGVREVVSWARLLGASTSVRSVYRWAKEGEIEAESAPDGRLLVRLSDVMDKCVEQRNRLWHTA